MSRNYFRDFLSKARDMGRKCSEENWDGCGSFPASISSYYSMSYFLSKLPFSNTEIMEKANLDIDGDGSYMIYFFDSNLGRFELSFPEESPAKIVWFKSNEKVHIEQLSISYLYSGSSVGRVLKVMRYIGFLPKEQEDNFRFIGFPPVREKI